MVRRAARNRIGVASAPALRLDERLQSAFVLDRALHRIVMELGAEQRAEEDVADGAVERARLGGPRVVKNDAVQPDLRRGGGGLARVVRLDRADGDERVGADADRLADQELE